MTKFEDVDLATVGTCATPECRRKVRQFSSVPIAGNGLDRTMAGPWHCAECIQKRCREAVERVNEARAAERSARD